MRSLRTIAALILREVSMSNGRSLLGYVWEIAEPVITILFFTLILGLFFRNPPMGTNFPLYYASGLLPLTIFLNISSRVATAVRFSRPLLTYPGVTFLDALIARFIVAALTKLMVFVIVLTAIVELYGLKAFFDYSKIATSLMMAMGMALALGSLNCLLISFVPLYERVWGLATRPLVLFSAVLYQFETVPLPYRDWLWWNPVAHMVGEMRSGIYPTYTASYVSVTYVTILIGTALPIALFFLRRYWREIIDNT